MLIEHMHIELMIADPLIRSKAPKLLNDHVVQIGYGSILTFQVWFETMCIATYF